MGPHTDTTQRIKASEELATSVCLGASELFGTSVYFCHLLSLLYNSLWFPAKECSTETAREKWNDRS